MRWLIALCVLCVPVTAQASETWTATAYCPCVKCCGKTPEDPAYGITASGKRADLGMVACNWLPFGTRLKIDGQIYTVQDRGARSIFGDKNRHIKRVDIYFPYHVQALHYGRKKVQVDILD